MDEDDEVVFVVARNIGNHGFARFRKIAATAAEGAFFEDLPAIGGDEFVMRIEDDEVEVVMRGFKKDEVFAAIAVEVSRNNVVEMGVLDWSFIAVEFGQFPGITGHGKPGDGIEAEESERADRGLSGGALPFFLW